MVVLGSFHHIEGFYSWLWLGDVKNDNFAGDLFFSLGAIFHSECQSRSGALAIMYFLKR